MKRLFLLHSWIGRTPWLILSAVAGIILAAGCSGAPPQNSQAKILADEAISRLKQNAGGELVLKAIEAQGGLEQWFSKKTSSYNWEYYNFGANLRFKSYRWSTCLPAKSIMKFQ